MPNFGPKCTADPLAHRHVVAQNSSLKQGGRFASVPGFQAGSCNLQLATEQTLVKTGFYAVYDTSPRVSEWGNQRLGQKPVIGDY
ncbi:hypothetical protein ON010_g17889 [Phytophthora cinnamomi]|nr:hypothetical protein ON010_g17889 [Phytophthora cinnamomi]